MDEIQMGEVIVGVILTIVTIAVIIWAVSRQKAKAGVSQLLNKHGEDALLAHRAIFMEGRERLPVALALTRESLFYDNLDLNARLDLDRIDEVEYDDETATGLSKVGHGVIRLRSHGHTFEFILTDSEIKEWQEHLPAHRLDEPGTITAS